MLFGARAKNDCPTPIPLLFRKPDLSRAFFMGSARLESQ
jgi:hypothetical protein